MRLLLDTHIALWVLAEPTRVAPVWVEAIEDPDNEVSVSAAAIWEIAIKYRLKRPDSPPFGGHEAIGHFESAGFTLLDISSVHAAYVEQLPVLHSDPFDRIMIAQAIIDRRNFVTFDRQLWRYDAPIMSL